MNPNHSFHSPFPSDRQFCGDMSISLGYIPKTFSLHRFLLRCAASLIPFVKGLYDGPPFYHVQRYFIVIPMRCCPRTIVLELTRSRRGSVADRSQFAQVGISSILCDSEASVRRSHRQVLAHAGRPIYFAMMPTWGRFSAPSLSLCRTIHSL